MSVSRPIAYSQHSRPLSLQQLQKMKHRLFTYSGMQIHADTVHELVKTSQTQQ
jgi:hypothetical protein